MSASTPDPTGVRRLVAAAEDTAKFLEREGMHVNATALELEESAAAVRVAELERVVKAARRVVALVCVDGCTASALRIFDALGEALAALDAGAKGGT